METVHVGTSISNIAIRRHQVVTVVGNCSSSYSFIRTNYCTALIATNPTTSIAIDRIALIITHTRTSISDRYCYLSITTVQRNKDGGMYVYCSTNMLYYNRKCIIYKPYYYVYLVVCIFE